MKRKLLMVALVPLFSVCAFAADGPGPQPGDKFAARTIHYQTDVQPILDSHCVKCHSGEKPKSDLNLSGKMTGLFSVSYENILRKRLVKSFREASDFGGSEAVPPKTIGSHKSKLITTIRSGHEGVKLSREEFIRLVTWVDASAQYYGSYYGRRNKKYKDHPNFRPVHTFEQAVSTTAPLAVNDR